MRPELSTLIFMQNTPRIITDLLPTSVFDDNILQRQGIITFYNLKFETFEIENAICYYII